MSWDLDQIILPTVQSYLAWPSLGDPGTYNRVKIVSTLVIIPWSTESFLYLIACTKHCNKSSGMGVSAICV